MAQSDADYAFIEEMRDWYYSFTNYIESEDEENDSLQKLKDVIAFERTQSKVSKALLDWTLEFLTTKFVHRLPLLCKRNYLFSYNGHVADNCFTESENSRLVRDPMGPRPSYRLHISCDAILQHTDENYRVLISDAKRYAHMRICAYTFLLKTSISHFVVFVLLVSQCTA